MENTRQLVQPDLPQIRQGIHHHHVVVSLGIHQLQVQLDHRKETQQDLPTVNLVFGWEWENTVFAKATTGV